MQYKGSLTSAPQDPAVGDSILSIFDVAKIDFAALHRGAWTEA